MLKKLLLIAMLSGVISGFGATAFQLLYTTPLILEAEVYETAEAPGPDAIAGNAPVHSDTDAGTAAAAHSPDSHEEWAPVDGIERSLSTLAANIFAGIGYAMLMVGAYRLWGGNVSLRTGVLWGGAGFFAFSLSPFFGLPPELPGMDAADLSSRQIWWVCTVLASSAGLALLAIPSIHRSERLRVVAGLLLIVAPHAIGAPHLAAESASLVPAHLSARFAVAAVAHGLIIWLLIGAASGWLFGRFIQDQHRGNEVARTV